jgi:subtilisin family serine protease
VYKGHGTHVAGTIAGRRATSGQQESDGEADGIARKAKLAFYDIGSLSGRLIAPLASNLFAPGYRAGARIHSSSWGIPGQNFYSGYDRAMDAYMYKNPDFLYVVAAGNAGFGDKRNTVATPAICKNGISVGASGNASPHTRPEQGGPNYVSEFSSRGPTRDGRRKPDVVAPGDSILSALAEPTVKGECGTSFKSGTSMATPVVSGAAALIRQYFREGWHVTGSRNTSVGFTPRASLVKAVLINGGQPLVAVQKKTGEITQSTSPYDVNQGFGRINLLESVPLQGKNSLKGLFVNGKSISNGSKHSYPITINDSSCGILSATLVWTDPEGAPNCNSGCMLNDLDLYVTKSGGSRYYPNGLDSADTINNAERVQIRNPSGTYTIYVEASDLIQAQEYSLSVTGCFTTGGNGSGGSGSGGSIGGGGDNDNENTTGGGGNSSETNCPDGSGRISIGNGKTRTCSWLKSNLSAYGNLCSFRDVAAECPSTCRACKLFSSSGSTKTASTRWDGKKRWYGNMFDIQAKKDLTIRSFDFHTNQSDSYRIKVFVKGGILSSRQSWREVCDATVTGSGVYGAPTRIPASACEPVSVSSGNWVTVYVTMTNASFLIMTGDVSTGTSLVNTADMRLRSGVGVTYGGSSVSIFKYKTFEDNAWNGNVHYTLDSSSVQEDGAAEEEGNDDADECLDQFGTVWMDDTVGNRTCAWLTEHRDRYGFVCAFADVSVFCPATCDYCT